MINPTQVVVFEPDLLFSSRIESLAKRLSVGIQVVSDLETLHRNLEANAPKLLILNLDELEGKLQLIRSDVSGKSWVAVGYYSHVKSDLAEEARRIGVVTVMPRSAFVSRMGEVFTRVLRKEG